MKPPLFLLLATLAWIAGALRAGAYTGAWPPSASLTDTKSAVPILATVTVVPPSITLSFPRAGKYQIFRKDPAASTWGAALVTQTAVSTSYTDSTASVGQLYEYKAIMTDGAVQFQIPAPLPLYTSASGSSPPTGYIMTGIQVDETQPKGRLVLVVTTDVQANLPAELAQYEADLAADGWFVHVISVAPATDYTSNGTGALDANGFPTAPFPSAHIGLRNQIIALYNQYPGQLKNVILLGKVPACRTGSTELYTVGSNSYPELVGDPDGHQVNLSCYGADGYYANMTGTWTDTGTNGNYLYKTSGTTTTGNSAITVAAGTLNTPGDNKFDQFYMKETGGQADLGFGRIDLSNGIADQYEALRFYLGKLHRYKIASPDFLPGRRAALRTGSFSNEDESFWMSAPAISGNLTSLDLIQNATPPLPVVESANFDADAAYTAQNGPYLFYVKGSGGPGISVGGKAVLWTGMQSHWGWWYSTGTSSGENTMALRLGEDSYCLSFTWNIFGLRYFYHRMSMGFDAGDMMRVSINNTDAITGTYAWTTDSTSTDGGYIASASGALFMDHFGDPTLRLYMFAPPSGLSVTPSGANPGLTWTASPEPTVSGYHIYRQDSAAAPFVRLTSAPVTGTSYVDSTVTSGAHTYMVRAVRLETTGGGTFYNASLGIQQAIDLTAGPAALQIATGAVLPDIYWSTPYSTTLSAQGGTPLYTWSQVSGALPPGLTLTSAGAFTGVATQAGTYTFAVTVADALGQSAQHTFTVTVQPSNTVTLLPEESAYVYSSAPTRVQGPTETMTVSGGSLIDHSFLRFNLAGLNPHHAFVAAKLRLSVTTGTTSGCIALLQAALSADAAGAAWTCSGSGTAVTYNTQPADNSVVPPVLATGFPVVGSYLDLDVTPLLQTALAGYGSGKVSFHLYTATLQTIALCSAYSYGNSRPQLILQTTDAPLIALVTPLVNPACVYAGSALQCSASVTAIPSRAGQLVTQWSQLSGPGPATFSTPTQAATGITFPVRGDYLLRLTADDGLLQSHVDLTVRVLAVPAVGPIDSLALRLPLDETSGTTAHDVSGVSPPNSGTLTGGPAWSTAGQFAGALSFNGAGQRVDVPDSAANLLDGTAQLSISFWLYANSLTTDSTYRGLLCKRFAAFNKEAWSIALRNGTIYADVNNTGNVVSARSVTVGKWYHLVLVYTGAGSNNLQLYLNGTPDKFATVTATSVPRYPTANLHLGAYDPSDTLGFNGLIDEVRIYQRALTLAEVQDLYAGVPANLGPVINTAGSVSALAGQPFSLNATATDDGLPAPLTTLWSQVSGPAGLSFGNTALPSTTGTAPLVGTYALRLSASDGAITTVANVSASITQTFASWSALHNLSGANALDTATPAHDGIANLTKYALGLDPAVTYNPGSGEPQTKLQSSGGLNYLSLSFTGTAPDVLYAVEAANSLAGPWSPVYTSSGGAAPGRVTVQDTQPISPSFPSRFLRLHLTRP